MRAAIVGGGIGGLAAAIALRRHGWSVTLFERAAAFEAVGAGITLMPNAVRALEVLGLGAAVRARSLSGHSGIIADSRGRPLVRRELSSVDGDGTRLVIMHRRDLVELLADQIPAEDIRLGVTVDAVTADGTLDVGGHRHRFDLVVGADGVHSRTRRCLWPKARVRHTGITAWRWVLDIEPPGLVGVMTGRAGEFGILPLGDRGTYVFAATPRGVHDLDGFADWADPVPTVLAATEGKLAHRDELLEVRPPRRMYSGRVALIGDAAHAMRPHLGQGAALAIEDAVVLAHHAPDLLAYNRARIRRVRAAHLLARSVTPAMIPASASLTTVRDVALRITPDALPLAIPTHLMAWRPPGQPPL